MTKEIPYITKSDLHYYGIYKPLVPTGRWKLVIDHYHTTALYIEHRRWFFFTTWINEWDIEFLPEEKEVIFDCNKRN